MDNPAESATPTDTTATSTARPVRNSGGVPGASSGGGREDCWSEGATAVLIEAWGERHLRCNRGNLRQTDWREVADAVNGREDGEKAPKSDVQCKNRIDTLKKKYKVEKAKSAPSTWPFFGRLDYLIGPGAGGKKAGSGGSGVNFRPKQRPSRFRLSSSPNLNPNSSGGGAIPKPRSGALAVLSGGSSSRLNSVDSSDSESSLGGGENGKGPAMSVRRKHSRLDDFVNSPVEETAFKELAKAILKFGEIYERIENSKQRQMMELERQRMEFTKELEFQRMNMLMEAQLEIEKVKCSKNASNSGETSNKL